MQVISAVGWYPDAELVWHDAMKNLLSFSYGTKAAFKAWRAGIKQKAGCCFGHWWGRKMRTSVSALTHCPYCSIWASCTSQWTGFIAACFTNGNVKARKCVAELGVIPLHASTSSSAMLPGSLFSWLRVFCIQPKGLLIHPAFPLGCHSVPAWFMCPAFPLIWIGIKIKTWFLYLNQE